MLQNMLEFLRSKEALEAAVFSFHEDVSRSRLRCPSAPGGGMDTAVLGLGSLGMDDMKEGWQWRFAAPQTGRLLVGPG